MRIAIVLALVCILAVVADDLTQVAQRRAADSRWEIARDALPRESVNFKILLKQNNLDKLEQTFWDVSTPSHLNYGQFLTQQEVADMVAPDAVAFKSVLSWLLKSGVPLRAITVGSDYIKVQTTVKVASSLLATRFVVYRSLLSSSTKLRILGGAHIPIELSEHVDFITGLSELIDDTRIKPKFWPALKVASSKNDALITPSVLKQYYNVPATAVGTGAVKQGIAAFSDYFSVGALQQFDKYFNVQSAVTASGADCLPDQCDQYESDLDVQYVTAMGTSVPTLFIAMNGDGEWILDWAQQLASMANPPLVNSISYGYPELEQCDITEACDTYGYTSQQYVTRTNTELQKLGTLGLTVLVSDGDDGAPALFGTSGNCPIAMNKYCPVGGCYYNYSYCPEITYTSDGAACYFPMGLGTDACQNFDTDIFQAWAEANSQCGVTLDFDNEGDPQVYSSCTCDKLKTSTITGVTIAPYTYSQSNGALFTPDYPTSSPYVTSVGATQFTWNSNGNITAEITASITTGAIITTGGGFSTFQAMPSYQTAAVNAYLSSGVALPPSYSYAPSMRAYPDIAFNGHNYQIFASNNSVNQDQCPCVSFPVDGTSCSSPALAGLLSLINDQLVKANKSPLGFVNPLLYQMAVSAPQAFTDIVSGDNACNRAYCCEYGFVATKGWDPVSGLGSPDFQQMLKYILSVKGVQN